MYVLTDSDIERIAHRTASVFKEMLAAPVTKQITQRQAYQHYGEANVKKLLKDGKLNIRKDSNRIYYYVSELEKHALPAKLIQENRKYTKRKSIKS